MTVSLIDRIDRIGTKATVRQLASNDYSWIARSLSSQSVDLNDTKYDYALAYLYVEPVRVCVDLYAQAASQVPYVLYQDDKEVARSDDPIVVHDFIRYLRNHRKDYFTGFFSSVVYEQILYDELMIELLLPDRDSTRLSPLQAKTVNGLRVLRGAASDAYFNQGKLQYVIFSGEDTSRHISADNIIYDKGYNPLSDYHGASRMQSVLDETNIINRLRRFLMRFLKKADRPDVYVALKNEARDQSAWEQTKEALRAYKNNEDDTMFGGSLPMEFASIPRPDANNQLDIDDKTRASIFRGFRVHPALAGDTQGTSYKQEHSAIYSTWVKTELMSLLMQADNVINDVMLPRMFPDQPGLRLEHDVTKFDIVTDDDKMKIEAADMRLKNGSITYGQHAELLGEDPADVPEEIRDCVQVEGVPVAREDIPNLAKWKFQAPASEQLAQAQLNEKQAQTTVPGTSETGDGDAIPQQMEAQYDANGTAIPQSEVFGYHIESGIVDINEARAQLGLPPITDNEANDTDLVQLNSQLQTVITAINAGMSIEEAYESVGLEPPKQDDSDVPPAPPQAGGNPFQQGKSITVSHGDHTHDISVKAFNPAQETAQDELSAWRTVSLKSAGKRDFEPAWLRGDIGDVLQAAILSANGDKALIAKAFDVARDTLDTHAKAIQATRIDFEDSVQDIMDKAIADNNYGRQQWSTAMRKIIRSACTKAYSDGLVSGGVLDGKLSEEDENTLASHIAEQSQYVTNLGAKIFKTESGISPELAEQKPVMWWNKSILPMFDAGQLSANENRMMEFAGNDGNESCTTCKSLKGQRHRHKWWARKALRPGIDTDNFECGGWKCEHKLVPVQASERA